MLPFWDSTTAEANPHTSVSFRPVDIFDADGHQLFRISDGLRGVKVANEIIALSARSPATIEALRGLPEIPDDDNDFTPDLARKIIAKYQELLRMKKPPRVTSAGGQGESL